MLDNEVFRFTDEENERRCNLIDKEVNGSLTDEEGIELEKLQVKMLLWRNLELEKTEKQK